MKFVVATYRVPDKTRKAYIDVLQRCRDGMQAEPDCRQFEVLVSPTDPEKVVVVAAFTSPEAHAALKNRSFVQAVMQSWPTMVTEKTFQNIFAEHVEVDHGPP